MEREKTVRNFEKWLKDHLLQTEKLSTPDIVKMELRAREGKLPLHEVLIQSGVFTAQEVLKMAHRVLQYDVVNLEETNIPEENFKIVPKRTMEKHVFVPVKMSKTDNVLTIATSNPSNLIALDEIKREAKMVVVPTFALHSQILHVIEGSSAFHDMSNIIEEMNGATPLTVEEIQDDSENLTEGKGDEPLVVRMVNSILSDAIQSKVSDIHIEPFEHHVRVRMRADGLLVEKIKNLDKKNHPAIISRLKVMGEMDIAETRRAQDGRFRMRAGNTVVDFRVSTMNTQYGEKIVLRLTIRDGQEQGIDSIGFGEEEKEIIKNVASKPYGLILVTGPTGSGKSTTLYGMINHVNQPSKNIVTIEDPIERQIPGVIQTPVNNKADINFSNGLKTILRQDPDIVMVGEIRDTETAETTIQAALTGHLVLSTLHTNDSAGAITRLRDMGVETFKIPSAVLAVIAQRLVRKNCTKCTVDAEASPEEIALMRTIAPTLDIPDRCTLKKGQGCKHCTNTGYKGREGIFEILIMDEEIKELTLRGENTTYIKNKAIEKGMKTMQFRGVEKVLDGLTTVEELRRVIFVE